MDPPTRSRSSRSPLARKSPPHYISNKSPLLLTPSHKHSSKLSLSQLTNPSPSYGLKSPGKATLIDKAWVGCAKKTARKPSKKRVGNKAKHNYSTSVSTAADSAAMDLGRGKTVYKWDEEVNAMRTPSSRRLVDRVITEEGPTSLESDLLAYSRTQISPKSIGLDYIQCETMSIPFYSVSPGHRLPKSQKHAVSLYWRGEDLTPVRSSTPPLERILHKKYLKAEEQPPERQSSIRLDTPKRHKKSRKPSLFDPVPMHALTPKTMEAAFKRRLKKDRPERPVIALPRLLPM